MAIYLSESDRDLVLDEMRMMLQSTQQIVAGLADNDMKNVEIAAKAAGMGSAIDLDPNFLSMLCAKPYLGRMSHTSWLVNFVCCP